MDETKTRWYQWIAGRGPCFFWGLWGVLGGAFAAVVLECAAALDVRKFLYDWQTLLAGFLAIAAARVALGGVRRQIQAADRLAEDRRRREERAAVAVLPLAVAQLSQYARECIQLLERRTLNPPGPIGPEMEVPRIPDSVISTMQICARYAEQENVEQIAKVLGKLQVQRSRLTNWVAAVKNTGRVDEGRRLEGLGHMFDAADLHAAIDELYAYARDIDLVRQDATQQQLTSALHNSGIWFESPIWELIWRRQ
jgi:hypothetical protein